MRQESGAKLLGESVSYSTKVVKFATFFVIARKFFKVDYD